MKILVTGATGYIGNKLVHRLAQMGNIVHALIRSNGNASILQHPNIRIFEGDITRMDSLERAVKDCSQVYHTAAFARLWAKNKEIFYEQNVGGTANMLEVAWKEGVKKFVHTSSCAVWSNCNDYIFTENDPRIDSFDNDYDLSKHLAENLVKKYAAKGLHTVIVNPSKVYGPGLNRFSNGVNRFIVQLLKQKISLLPWNLEAKGNYSFIDDVVDGHIRAMEKGENGERYILGGENKSLRELIQTVKEISKSKNMLVRIPFPILKTWSRLEILRSKWSKHEPYITPNMVQRFHSDKMFDPAKAIKELGYHITPFEKGMIQTINHLNISKYE